MFQWELKTRPTNRFSRHFAPVLSGSSSTGWNIHTAECYSGQSLPCQTAAVKRNATKPDGTLHLPAPNQPARTRGDLGGSIQASRARLRMIRLIREVLQPATVQVQLFPLILEVKEGGGGWRLSVCVKVPPRENAIAWERRTEGRRGGGRKERGESKKRMKKKEKKIPLRVHKFEI